MKAKDLAELLLQNPDLDVFVEEMRDTRDGDYYYHPSEVGSVQLTPSGVFLTLSVVDYKSSLDIQNPHKKPVLYSTKIKLEDHDPLYPEMIPEYFPCIGDGYDEHDDLTTGYFWQSLMDYGYYESYIPGENKVYFITTDPPEYADEDSDIYIPEDVLSVEVLTHVDDATWDCTWSTMTFEEAYEFFKKLYPTG